MIAYDPVASPYVLAFIAVLIIGCAVVEAIYDPWRGRKATLANIAVAIGIAACVVGCGLRPYMPGNAEEGGQDAQFKDIDVIFVVDTTRSMIAEDAQGGSRIEAARNDVKQILSELPGCSAAVVGFDNQARILSPFTTDTESVIDAVAVTSPPDYLFASGTDLSKPFAQVRKLINRRVGSVGRKVTLMFVLSDGEDTENGTAPEIKDIAAYVDGGAVIGYGTSSGAKMDNGYGGYVTDPDTGMPAVSKIDETALTSMASQLGIDYVHESALDQITGQIRAIWEASPSYNGTLAHLGQRTEFYWIFAIPLAALLLFWVAGSVGEGLRARRATREVRS